MTIDPQATSLSPTSGQAASHDIDALRVEGLSHTYPPAKRARRRAPSTTPDAALNDVSLSVRPGEIFGILGPNGGGKSTLFRILCTLMRPSDPQGAMTVFGHSVLDQPADVRRQLGVVFQSPSVDLKLTAEENLRHQGHLYGLRGAMLKQRIDEQLAHFDLADRRHDDVEHFSGGMRRRVELAKALLHNPKLLLLDEPSTGLDPAARRTLWDQLHQLRDQSGVTVIATTHLMDEAERCDRLAIMHEGRCIATDTPANLTATIGGDVIVLEPIAGSDVDQLTQQLTDRFGPWRDGNMPQITHGHVHLQIENGPQRVAEISAAFATHIRSITVSKPTLEDVFMQLTGKGISDF